MRSRLCWSVIAGWSLLFAAPVWACSIPVFRYALERWPADPYQVMVFHRGELSEQHQAVLSKLQPQDLGLGSQNPARHANVQVHAIDLDANPKPEALELWQAQKTDTLPWMAVYNPILAPEASRVWSGPLSETAVDRLLNSPVRREIARRILNGDSVVWVLLESGNPEKDDAAFRLLNSRVHMLESTLKLPVVDQQDLADGSLSIDPGALKLAFSSVRLSRDDPAETMFVEMLLSVESDLRDPEYRGQPMAFPIFGRGRALYALLGAGISEQTVEDACRFLVGACQCTVKIQNPGIDMLMPVDWEGLIEPTAGIVSAFPPLSGPAGFGDDGERASEPSPAKNDTADEVALADALGGTSSAKAARRENGTGGGSGTVSTSTPRHSREPSETVDKRAVLTRNALWAAGLLAVIVMAASLFLIPRKG